MGFQVGHGELHSLGALQHFGDNQLVGVELTPYFVHTGHQRAVDDGQGGAFLQRQIQVVGQPLLAAFYDALRQSVVQGQSQAFLGGSAGRAVAEVGGEGGHRIVAPMPNQILGKAALLLRYGSVALHQFRVDDRQIQAGQSAVVQKNGVEHLAPGGRQPERNIGNAQHGFGVGQSLLNQAHAFDGFGGGTDIVFIAGAGGEHQGVKDDVLFRHPVLFGEQAVGAAGDFQLARAGDSLGLVGVVVNAAHHQGGAVAARQRDNAPEAFLAVLQVDGVDDRLALQPFQRFLNHGGVGGVNHNGGFDPAIELIQELDHIGGFVPVGVLQANIQNVGAVANLAASDFGGFLKAVAGDETLEAAAAEDIGALAHNGGAGVVVDHHRFDAGNAGFQGRRGAAGRFAGHGIANPADVFGPGAAAAAGHIQPAVVGKPRQRAGQHRRRFVVVAVLIGQAGVGNAGNAEAGQALQRPQMVGHKLRPGGAVETHPQQLAMRQRGVQRLGILAGQQRPHRLNGALHRHRNGAAQLRLRPVNSLQAGLDVDGVLAGLQQQHIGAAFNQPGGLLVVVGGQFVKGEAAGNGNGAGGRAHSAGDEAGLGGIGGGVVGGGAAGDGGGGAVDAAGVFGQVVLAKNHGGGAEGVGFNDVGAGVQIGAVDVIDDIRAGEVEVFVAAFIIGAAEVVGAQVAGLDLGSHGAVHHQDAAGEGDFQFSNAGVGVHRYYSSLPGWCAG